jgi:chromosome segregation ATPase
MSSENSYEQSVYSSTQASSTPGSDTPSASEIMSTTPTPTANFQISSPAYENMLRSFQDTFTSLRAEMARLEIENKRLVEHNTVIEKELETLNEHNTATEKELETLNEENVKFSGAKDDAMKKLAEVEEEKTGLQKELDGLEGLKEVLGWKKRCEELENRATENQERMEKLFEDYQQKTEKRIAEVQQGQQNLEQEIDRIKADHTLEMQGLTSAMGFMGLEDLKGDYIFREEVSLDDCVDRINMCQ